MAVPSPYKVPERSCYNKQDSSLRKLKRAEVGDIPTGLGLTHGPCRRSVSPSVLTTRQLDSLSCLDRAWDPGPEHRCWPLPGWPLPSPVKAGAPPSGPGAGVLPQQPSFMVVGVLKPQSCFPSTRIQSSQLSRLAP